jgi:hypothetical protein
VVSHYGGPASDYTHFGTGPHIACPWPPGEDRFLKLPRERAGAMRNGWRLFLLVWLALIVFSCCALQAELFKGPSCFQFHQMTENGKGGVDMRLTCSGMPGSSSSSARTENFNFMSDRPKDMLLGLPRRSIHQFTESLRPVIRQRPQVQSLILYM